jgi:hypothetical protein
MKNKKTDEIEAGICPPNGKLIQLYVRPLAQAIRAESGEPKIPRLFPVEAELQFSSQYDQDVRCVLVDRALRLVHTQTKVVQAALPVGQLHHVRPTVTLGYVNHTADGCVTPVFCLFHHVDQKLLPALRQELLEWWATLPIKRRIELNFSFSDNPDTSW